MKAIKLSAIAAILFLAFSCNKGKMRPVPMVNDGERYTLENPFKVDKPEPRNDDSFPLYQNSIKVFKSGIGNNKQFPKF